MKTTSPEASHHLHVDDVIQLLDVGLAQGLTHRDVLLRQNKFGRNRVTPARERSPWLRALDQFHQPLVYLLLIATVVTASLGQIVDASVIFSVVLLNATIGFFQESKATHAIEALSRLIITEVSVRREGRRERISAEELVPGDVVLIEPGDRISADLRLFHCKDLQIDESTLTGESLPVFKHPETLALDTVVADRKNLAFAGTLVTAGYGEGLVWAIGDKTETGRIAWLLADITDISTPLTRKIAHFSQNLLWIILAVAGVLFAGGVALGKPVVEMFFSAVALSVGAIPEGLPAAVTIVLAIGVSRMARRQAIVRRLSAVETLGSTTVICTDKTGTLTLNKMTVREIFAGSRSYLIGGSGETTGEHIQFRDKQAEMSQHPALAECLRAGVLCNTAEVARGTARLKVEGDPTEVALVIAGEKGGLSHADTRQASPLVDAIPFGSEHMFRATLHEAHAGRVIYKVGAAEKILERCSFMLNDDGEKIPIDRETVVRKMQEMAARGLRVLAMARRRVGATHDRLHHSHVAEGLTLLGFQGMLDPPRDEVIAAVRKCQSAGIAVKMITGDHLLTARAIARHVGIAGPDAEVRALSGRELDAISETDLPELAERTLVFARVTAEQKLRLVRALQTRHHIVAMTGDGVNDAPALRQADIGVAMGKAGTDVARSAAAMILADDNFASIEAAVEEGRGIFENLTKFIVWIVPTNAGEALLLLAAVLAGLPLPILPIQLLWVNLTDTLLGLPLAFERTETDVMRRPPRDPQAPLFNRALLARTGLVTLTMLAGALWIFASRMGTPEGIAAARTAVINTVVLVEIAYLFNCRSLHQPCFTRHFFANRWAFLGALAMFGAQLLFTYAPWMNRVFHSAPIDAGAWLQAFAIAAAIFLLVEFEKWLRHRDLRRPAKLVP